MNATKTTFSQRLISALRDRGMSQSDLAQALETISKDDLSVAYFRIVGRVIGRIGAGGF